MESQQKIVGHNFSPRLSVEYQNAATVHCPSGKVMVEFQFFETFKNVGTLTKSLGHTLGNHPNHHNNPDRTQRPNLRTKLRNLATRPRNPETKLKDPGSKLRDPLVPN